MTNAVRLYRTSKIELCGRKIKKSQTEFEMNFFQFVELIYIEEFEIEMLQGQSIAGIHKFRAVYVTLYFPSDLNSNWKVFL